MMAWIMLVAYLVSPHDNDSFMLGEDQRSVKNPGPFYDWREQFDFDWAHSTSRDLAIFLGVPMLNTCGEGPNATD